MSWRSCVLSSRSYAALYGSIVTQRQNVKVGWNVTILQKNETFIILGRNVTAELDKNTGTKCHRLWKWVEVSHCAQNHFNSRSECHIFGWTYSPFTLSWHVTVVKLSQQTVCLGWNVPWSVCGWADRHGTTIRGLEVLGHGSLGLICIHILVLPSPPPDTEKSLAATIIVGFHSLPLTDKVLEKKIMADVFRYRLHTFSLTQTLYS
jgi:hypothetical protein